MAKPRFSSELKPLSIPCKRTGPTRKLWIIYNWLTILRLLLISNVNTNVNKPVKLEANNNLSDMLEAYNNLSKTVSLVHNRLKYEKVNFYKDKFQNAT